MPTIRFTRTHSIVLTAALAALLAACGGGGSDESPPLTPQISGVVDDTRVNADTMLAGLFKADAPTLLLAVRTDTATQGRFFLLVTKDSAPGTYLCSDGNTLVASGDVQRASETIDWAEAPLSNPYAAGTNEGTTLGSCSITITSRDADFITGTFTATLENETRTSTKTVTGGTFRVPYIPLPTT